MDVATIFTIISAIFGGIGVVIAVMTAVFNVKDKKEISSNKFLIILLVIFLFLSALFFVVAFLINSFNKRPKDFFDSRDEITSIFSQSILESDNFISSFETSEEDSDTDIPVCLTSLERVKFGCYTGNLGDSRLNVLGDAYEYGYGDVGVNGEVFRDGFEGWVARWNPVPEISWVFAIYDLDGKYNSLSVSTGLIQSYNTKDFNTTLYFYGDDVDTPLHSQVLTNEEYKYNFNVDVTGVKHLKIMLKDNIAVKGGTSFAIHNLYLT